MGQEPNPINLVAKRFTSTTHVEPHAGADAEGKGKP